MFFGRRYYDQDDGSWLTLDPLGLSQGPNLYAYVGNNPYMLIDEYGLKLRWNWKKIAKCVVIAFVAVVVCQQLWGAKEGLKALVAPLPSAANSGNSSGGGGGGTSDSETGDRFQQEFHMVDGKKIERDTNYPSQALVVTRDEYKTTKGLINNNRGKNFTEKGIPTIINGVGTTLYHQTSRALTMVDEDEDLPAVIVLHNSTNGIIADVAECICQVFGFKTEVVTTLEEQYSALLGEFAAANISFKSDIHAHSQGGLIANEISHSTDPMIKKFRRKIFTYGGAYTIKGATNYWAPFDLVPVLNIFSYTAQIFRGFKDVTYGSTYFQSPLEAHGYENRSYQECYKRSQSNDF
ncbi:MAG: RHS repeat-associated core domain-containing protein [Chlamydia sp.]